MKRVVLIVGAALALAACGGAEPPEDWIARVGDAYLTEAELLERYPQLRGRPDSAAARAQLIESWVTDQLLYREATDRQIEQVDSVRRRIEAGRRQVLVDELARAMKQNVEAPSPSELRAYYERHREDLRLREPYLRIRFISSRQVDSLRAVRERIAGNDSLLEASSHWRALENRLGDTEERRTAFSSGYHPLSVLERALPPGGPNLDQLSAGDPGVLWTEGERGHLLYVLERVPEGSVPEFAWVRERIREQVLIRRKKLNYNRQVQRLRTQARANDLLEVKP